MNESMPRSGDAAGGVKSQIREKAADLAQGAKEQARAQYDDKKGVAVGELGTLASSLRRVVDDLGTSNPNNMSGKVVSTIADRLESFSQSLEGKDLDNVVRDVETFARRNPAAFLGGAIALGFIASRFLKSSAGPSSGGDFYSSDPYGEYFTGNRTDSSMNTAGFSGGATAGAGIYSGGGLGSTGGGTTGSTVGSGGSTLGNSGSTLGSSGSSVGSGASTLGSGASTLGSGASTLDTPNDFGIGSGTDTGRTGRQ